MSSYATAAAIDRYIATAKQIEKKKDETTRLVAKEVHAGLSEVAEAINQIAGVMRIK
jgi:hypothetical protein